MATIRPTTIGPNTTKTKTTRVRTVSNREPAPTTNGGEPTEISIPRPDSAPEAPPVSAGSLGGSASVSIAGDALAWEGSGLAGLYSAVQVLAAGQSALWERVKCDPQVDAVAAIPERFELKIGRDVSQAIIQYSEDLGDGKLGPPMYPLTVPHYRLSEAETEKTIFPSYSKGNRVGIITLNDNSKSVFNCSNEAEANRMYGFVISLINGGATQNHQFSNNVRRGANLNRITVKPKIVKFFSNGQRDTKPDWIVYLRQ